MLPGAESLTTIDLPDSVRGLPKEELAKAAREVSGEISISCADSLKDALKQTESASPEDVYLVFGSLSLMQLFKEN